MSTDSADLISLFGKLPSIAVEELKSMLRLYDITPEELFFKWESYCIRLGYDSDVKISVEHVTDFKRDVQKMLEAEVRGKRGVGGGGKAAGTRVIKAEMVEGGVDVLGLIEIEAGGNAIEIRMEEKEKKEKEGKERVVEETVFANFEGLESSGLRAEGPPVWVQNRFDTPRKNTGAKRKFERTPYDNPSPKKYAADKIASSPLPLRTPFKTLSISQPPLTPFSKRPSPFTIRETLNAHLPKPDVTPTAVGSYTPRVRLVANTDVKKFAYRCMHQKLYESSKTLDNKIYTFLLLISEAYNIPFEEFTDPSATSPEEVVAVGRICSDSVIDGKINHASLLLESCRCIGAGSRVPLKFDKLEKIPPGMAAEGGNGGISLFPGQIIALRGVNPTGRSFSVREILEIPRLPPAAIPMAALASPKDGGGLRMMIAAGPYTTHNNLDYEPLTELCQRARNTKPDVLLLLGPFVDIDHPMVAEGDFELEDEDLETDGCGTLEDLFKQRIMGIIKIVDSVSTMVILIPSTRDAVSNHVAYPQEAFSKKELELPKNVRCLPNPAMFSLNNTVFGTTTADPLFDLVRSQILLTPPPQALSSPSLQSNTTAINPISNAPSNSDTHTQAQTQLQSTPPTTRAIRHILTQRAFYPVFPPTATILPPTPAAATTPTNPNTNTNTGCPLQLDIAYLGLADIVNVLPDVLVLPSHLDAFARTVDSVVAVNPGCVCRKAGYGTFAEVWIGPIGEANGADGGSSGDGGGKVEVGPDGKVESTGQIIEHKVWERARVDVIRI